MHWVDLLNGLTSGVTAVGVVTLFLEAWKLRRDDRARLKAEEVNTKEMSRRMSFENYKSIDDKYFHFLSLISQHPQLQLSLLSPVVSDLSPHEEIRRFILIEMLFGVMETAYVGRDVSIEHRLRRWPAWEQFIAAHLRRSDVRMVWFRWKANRVKRGHTAMDLDFEDYVEKTLKNLMRQKLISPTTIEAEQAEAEREELCFDTDESMK